VEGPAAYWNMSGSRELFLDNFDDLDVLNSDEQGQRIVKRGGCLSTPQIVSSSSMKRWIGSYFSVSVIDMESFWVSETAASCGVPRIVVRAIFDPVEQDLPDFIITAVENKEKRPVGRAIRHMLSNPVDAPKIVRLANQSRLAAKSLASYLTKVSAEYI
jgi:adenosylhomocysteine nucleosidase